MVWKGGPFKRATAEKGTCMFGKLEPAAAGWHAEWLTSEYIPAEAGCVVG